MSTIKPDGEYWQPELETMPREQLQQLQAKLKETLKIRLQSPFYKKRFGEAEAITADSIKRPDDIREDSLSPRSRTFATTILSAS